MDKNIIDYGSWNVPRGWNELDLKTFQEIERYYEDKDKKFDVREVLHILTNRTTDEIDQLPVEVVELLMNKLLWLQEAPKYEKPTASLEIDGVKYVVNVQEKMKLGEFVAVDGLLKNDKHNYAAMMGILCRKEGELYDSKFENEVLESRIIMWEKQPMMKVMRVIAFFLNCYIMLEIPSKLSLVVEEELDRIVKNTETLEKLGVFKRQYIKWRIKTLKKSLNSIKNT